MQLERRPGNYTVTIDISFLANYAWVLYGERMRLFLDQQWHIKSPMNKADVLDCLVSRSIELGITLAWRREINNIVQAIRPLV